MSAVANCDQYITYIEEAPAWFIWEFFNKLKLGVCAPEIALPIFHTRCILANAGIAERIGGDQLLPMIKSKVTGGLRWKNEWIERHPGATAQDGERMLELMSEARQVGPGYEATCHFRFSLMGLSNAWMLIQWFREGAPNNALPVAVYEEVRYVPLAGVPPENPVGFRMAEDALEDAHAIYSQLHPCMWMKSMAPVVSHCTFDSDTLGNLIQDLANIEQDGQGTELDSESEPQALSSESEWSEDLEGDDINLDPCFWMDPPPLPAGPLGFLDLFESWLRQAPAYNLNSLD